MNEFAFELATPADDPALRRLLARNPVPGQVTVTYEREPDYFRGCGVMGHFCQVGVARHQPSGLVAGLGCRAIRPLFVNGQAMEVGYLGQLRVEARFQGRWLVPLGFRFLHQLHADGRVSGYITTIIAENTVAEGILVHRARSHLPVYRPVDRLCTVAIILRRPLYARSRGETAAYEIRPGTIADLPAMIAFLNQHGRMKQFFPVYTSADFEPGQDNPLSTTLAFRIEDFLLACRHGKIVGLLGLWDQSSYKQTVVQAYGGSLGWLRPLYNAGARLLGAQAMPSPGQPLHFAYASFICLADNDPHLFALLLRRIYQLATERGYAYLMVGLSSRDPLLAVARQYAHVPYYSQLYTVCWSDSADFHEQLDRRLPYVEIATL